MARTKTNTRNDTKTLTTSWRNRHLDKLYFCVFRIKPYHKIKESLPHWEELLKSRNHALQPLYPLPCTDLCQRSIRMHYFLIRNITVSTEFKRWQIFVKMYTFERLWYCYWLWTAYKQSLTSPRDSIVCQYGPLGSKTLVFGNHLLYTWHLKVRIF